MYPSVSGQNDGVVDWIKLTKDNVGKKGKGGRRRKGVEDDPLLMVVEDKTLTVPLSGSWAPHATRTLEGCVTVKATPHTSIVLQQRASVSPKNSTMWRPSSSSSQKPFHTSITQGNHSYPSLSIAESSPAVKQTKRDRKILAGIITGKVTTVRSLPLPELFE